ncbi:MAG: energy transducer TonB [Bryobacterales bacterium]|nr:energy transducer TonB [Bryobacterales bacterium]
MFEQVMLQQNGRTRRPWLVVMSFAGELAAVALAALLPLIVTDTLPRARLLSIVLAPGAPPGRPRAAAAPRLKAARRAAPQAAAHGLQAPVRIPDEVTLIIDEPVPAIESAGGLEFGVPGSIGPAAREAAAPLVRLLQAIPAPAAPPPVESPVSPAAAAPRRIVVGGNVQAARLIHRVMPAYPVLARQARVAGTVRLQAVISTGGTIRSLKLISGHPLLTRAAIEAVSQWVYEPLLLNGEPVEVDTQVDVHFTLQ